MEEWNKLLETACHDELDKIVHIDPEKIEYAFGITLVNNANEKFFYHAVIKKDGLFLQYENEPLIEEMIVDLDNFTYSIRYQNAERNVKLELPDTNHQLITNINIDDDMRNKINMYQTNPLSIIKNGEQLYPKTLQEETKTTSKKVKK